MTIRHHPSLSLRSDYAASSLPPGAALAVAAHLKLCAVCAIAAESMTGPGEPNEETGMASRSRRSFAGRTARPANPASPSRAPRENGMPVAMQNWRAGPWRFMGPGLRLAALKEVSGLGEAVHLLKARPGGRLRLGGGVEQLLVLEGGFTTRDQAYEAGDFIDLSEEPIRQATADARAGGMLMIVSDDSWPRSRLLRFLLSRAWDSRD